MDNALKQYTDLYRQHAATVCGKSAAPLNGARAAALEALSDARLPRAGQDGYMHTDLNAMFAPDYGVNITRLGFRADAREAFRCGVPGVSALTGIVANDFFSPADALARHAPDGLTVCSFSDAAARCPGVLEKYYNTVASPQQAANAAVALNTLLVQEGVLVHVARGVKVTNPVQLIAVLGGVTMPMLAFRRLLVVMEEDSALNLLLCDHASGAKAADGSDVPTATDSVIEVCLERDAHLSLCSMEENAATTSRYCFTGVAQAHGSHFDGNVSTLRCGNTRNDLRVSLDGEHADCRLYGMTIAGGDQHADNATIILHNAPRCHSDQLFKYVAEGDSRCAFEGLIRVGAGAHHTEAYQNNRNMLASRGARMHTRPQLEIYCDDVRANHGAATGQLDNDALFYMQTRGIPREQARTMLMQAFMSDVIDSMSPAPLRERMRQLVSRRLGNPGDDGALCATCGTANDGPDAL